MTDLLLPSTADNPSNADAIIFDGGTSLGPRLEFSINMDMIKERQATTEAFTLGQAGSGNSMSPTRELQQRSQLPRRRTLRHLISTHVRKASDNSAAATPSARHLDGDRKPNISAGKTAAAYKADSQHHQDNTYVDRALPSFRLPMWNLPSPIDSFGPDLDWSAVSAAADASVLPVVHRVDKLDSIEENTVEITDIPVSNEVALDEISPEIKDPAIEKAAEFVSTPALASSPRQQPASAIKYVPTHIVDCEIQQQTAPQGLRRLKSLKSLIKKRNPSSDIPNQSAGDAKGPFGTQEYRPVTRKPISRRWSIGHQFYSGLEPSTGSAPANASTVSVATPAAENPVGKPPRRGRSLMFKPLVNVAAVGALIDTIGKTKPEAGGNSINNSDNSKTTPEARPDGSNALPAQQGPHRRILGSLRRAAANTGNASNAKARTSSKQGYRPIIKPEAIEDCVDVDEGEHAQPKSHGIYPIEYTQPNDNIGDKNSGTAVKRSDALRHVKRRAGTLNLGQRNPIRVDKLKHAPSADKAPGTTAKMTPTASSLTVDYMSASTAVPGYVPIAVSLRSSRSRQFMLNTPLGEFEVQRTLGQGSYGKVKLMRSALTHEQFAVKIIKRYPAHKHRRGHHEYRKAKTLDRRVVREANLAAILGQLHPHIVPLHDFRVTDTHFYLFYAYVNGVTLAERVG
ncbi:Serine/threonine-protein kinase, partial [Kickxella alabastrina]